MMHAEQGQMHHHDFDDATLAYQERLLSRAPRGLASVAAPGELSVLMQVRRRQDVRKVLNFGRLLKRD